MFPLYDLGVGFKGKCWAVYGSTGFLGFHNGSVLGGSVISGVRSPPLWVISIVTLLITLLITTHEPPFKVLTRVLI